MGGLTAVSSRDAFLRASPEAVPMVKLTDDELDAVMSAARPLQIDMRDAFLHAVAHELGGYQEVGPGIVHQVCREQQRIFMNGAWPDVSRSREQSKWR